MLKQIGFFAHTHGFFSENIYYPVEVAIVHIESEFSSLLTIKPDATNYTDKDMKCNKWFTKNIHQIPFPFIGVTPLNEARAFINQIYHEKDLGKGYLVAYKGREHEYFLKSCEIPIVNIDTIFSKNDPSVELLLPLYIYPFPNCNIHEKGNSETCCRRIVYVLAKFIKEKKEDELWDEDNKQENDKLIVESFEPFRSLIEINLKKAIENKQNVRIELNGQNLNINFSANE
ncbi:hypothetical protein TNCV_247611 [Trichonephila clavipes]|nr:hypothetical protein TNCV_247611 [Trichonephila clavipes]